MPSPDPVGRRIAAIEALAETGEWSEIEAAVRALPALVDSLPERDRQPALTALMALLDSLRTRVESESEAVGAELGALRDGRRAAERYRDCAAALSRPEIGNTVTQATKPADIPR